MSGVAGIAKGIVLFCDFINTIDAVNKVQSGAGSDFIHKAYLINRFVILGCVFAELELQASGAKADSLLEEKLVEFIPRTVDIMIKLFKEGLQFDEELKRGETDFSRGFIRVLEKGLLAPCSDLFRVGAEIGMYSEQRLLELSPEEFSHTTRTVPDGLDNIKEVPLNREECIANRAECEQMAVMCSFIRGGAESETVNATVRTAGNVSYALVKYFRDFRRWMENLPPIPPVNAQAPERERPQMVSSSVQTDPLPEREMIDLVGWPFIIPPLHGDSFFGDIKYKCPITREPIRDPVGDPFTNTLYERASILIWLRKRPSCPLNPDQPLRPDQLIEKPVLKAFIDNRLKAYQDKMLRYMESSEFQKDFAIPLSEELEAAIKLESPNL